MVIGIYLCLCRLAGYIHLVLEFSKRTDTMAFTCLVMYYIQLRFFLAF